MRKRKLGKSSTNHVVSIIARNIKTNEELTFSSFKSACSKLNISRSSILKSCKYGISSRGYQFFYANQSGSSKNKELEHAQRLGREPVITEFNRPTSPRFPKKYMDNKEAILSLSQTLKAHSIAKELDLDRGMTYLS